MRKSWSDIKTDRGLLCDIVNLKIGLLRIGTGGGGRGIDEGFADKVYCLRVD